MSFDGHYIDSAPSGKMEHSAILSVEDVRRCREISARHRDRVKAIALAVAAETSLPISAIYGRSRVSHIVYARRLVMYLARKQGLSFEAIGRALNRDHSTIRHGFIAECKRRGEA